MAMYQKCATDTSAAAAIATPASLPLLEMYHEDCTTTAQKTACAPQKATPTMTCDANMLEELYTKCETGTT